MAIAPMAPLLTAHERNWEMIESALEGMDEETMNRQPSEQCNSVSWLLWHMSRVLDMVGHGRAQDLPRKTEEWVGPPPKSPVGRRLPKRFKWPTILW